MRVQIEEINQVSRKVRVEVPAQRVSERLDKAYQDLKKTAQLRGFRPGRAPRSILERYFGEQVREKVGSEIIEETFGEVLREHQLKTVGPLTVEEMDLKPGQEMRYTVTVEVLPDIQVGDYEGLELPHREVSVTEEQVSARIEEIRDLFARLEDVAEPRPIQEGDFVSVTITSLVDGQRVGAEGGEERVLEVREGVLEKRFHDALLGLKPGEAASIPYRFPSDHPDKRAAGKEGALEVAVEKIRRKILPDLDDGFARRLGEYANLDELRLKIRSELEEEERRKLEAQTREVIVEQLLKRHQFDVPESLVNSQLEAMVRQSQRRLVVEGLGKEETEGILEQMRLRYREPAVRSVRASLVLQAIADKEGLEVTEERLQQAMERIARDAGMDLTQVKRMYEGQQRLEGLKESVREDLALDFLKQRAKMVARTTGQD